MFTMYTILYNAYYLSYEARIGIAIIIIGALKYDHVSMHACMNVS